MSIRLCKQGVMSSLLNDASLFHDNNAVRGFYSGQTVSNQDTGCLLQD